MACSLPFHFPSVNSSFLLNWRVENIAGFPLAESKIGLHELGLKAFLVYPAEATISPHNAVIGLSRLPLRWPSNASWQTNARQLLEHLKKNDETLATTVGMMGWDFLTWLAGVIGVRMLVILPPGSVADSIGQIDKSINDLCLSEANVTFVAPIASKRLDRAISYPLRDKLMLDFGRCYYPLVTRPGGFWDKIVASHSHVNDTFLVPYPSAVRTKLCSSLVQSSKGKDFLWTDNFIHLTRGVFGPWSGETKADYFSALFTKDGENPRDEFATLTYILNSGILRGSGSKIRSAIPVVSFSVLNPYEILGLNRSFAHRPGSTFEPYGLAISKRALLDLGVRPVIYGEEKEYQKISEAERPYFQHTGKVPRTDDGHSWSLEKEYRLLGDLDLTSLRECVTALLPTAREAEDVTRLTGFRALNLFE